MGGDYTLLFHQVFKSIAYGTYEYYSDQHSTVPNVFLPIRGMQGLQLSYFTRVYFLRYLADFSSEVSRAGTGYIPVADARSFLLDIGLDEGQISELTKELFESELIEPDIKMLSAVDDWTYMRISAWGYYVTRTLIGRFAYLEAVMLDTPLVDKALLEQLFGTYRSGKPLLAQRVSCVQSFLRSMSHIEDQEQLRVEGAGLGEHCPPLIVSIEELVRADIKSIEAVIMESVVRDGREPP